MVIIIIADIKIQLQIFYNIIRIVAGFMKICGIISIVFGRSFDSKPFVVWK